MYNVEGLRSPEFRIRTQANDMRVQIRFMDACVKMCGSQIRDECAVVANVIVGCKCGQV
jgi:hypothetical protein